jgi:5-methylcytosine-specific restriction protein A
MQDEDIKQRYAFINNLKIGDIFTRDQLMAIFKISGQAGMMKTNTLNALVLTTSEESIYGDSNIEDGTIQYTGEGLEGDQTITKNNKTLFYSRDNDLPVYLFTKDKKRRYTFEGRVELYDKPYQTPENDINGDERLVWKFPLKVVYSENDSVDETIKDISHEIVEISNSIQTDDNKDIIYDEEPLELRKYRKNDVDRKVNRTKKPDYIAEELVKTKQGELNEKTIYERELQRVMELEAQEAIKKMEEFFKNKNDSEGYDILSFEQQEDGTLKEIYIEVKSTKGNEGTPIDITDNELEFAKKHVDHYYLYRIYNSDKNNKKLKIVSGEELLENYLFIPANYKIYSQ